MLLTKSVEVVLTCKNIAYYESLGYEIPRYWDKKHKKMSIKRGTKIVVKIEDLAKGSHEKVDVKCDYCDTVKRVSYKDYLKNHDEKLGDCCIQCRHIKYKETMIEKYGAYNTMLVPELLEKVKQTNHEKYGYDWHMQRPEYQDSYKGVMMERYGAEHALQVPEFSEQANISRHKTFRNHTSKPQRKLGAMLMEIYGNCVLEKICGKYSLDCFVEIDGYFVDIEYDGWFYHQDIERDNKRDKYMIEHGYKVLRIRSNKSDDIPTYNQIEESVNKLLHDRQDVVIIQM